MRRLGFTCRPWLQAQNLSAKSSCRPGCAILVLQSQVHVLEDKELLEYPEATLTSLTKFLGVPMSRLPQWDKEFVQSALQKT